MSTCGTRRRVTAYLLLFVVPALFLIGAEATNAMPLSPELVEKLKASGELPAVIESMEEARAKGVWAPSPSIGSKEKAAGQALMFDPQAPDTIRVLVILVDFSDHPASGGVVYGQPADFMHLLFSYDPADNHYSMAEFYRDNSYGNFIMDGQVVGWVRAPETYAYYVDGQKGFGTYPQNAQKMAEDAILLADPMVDYSQFDADGNGWLDGVFVVHSGPGYETTGDVNDVHSHKWSLRTTLYLDGVSISSYTMEPEESPSSGLSTMGVYAHEYGHFLGLPDLYDTDYSSSGIGDWSLMAGGSWNVGGRRPAFMDAWCKKELGFLTPVNITAGTASMPIASSYDEPVAYRLWANGSVGPQYFLIENRRRIGYDVGIPASGLMIYHIDEDQWGNTDESHPLVAVEQADGLFDLENGLNSGDGGDVWSAGTNANFDDLSTPNSRGYFSYVTGTAVWDISAPDSVMYAGFDIAFTRPRFELLSGTFSDSEFGNGNGIVETGETLTFTFSLRNEWATGTNVTGTLTADNNDIVFTTPSVNIGTVDGDGGTGGNTLDPIVFEVPTSFTPCIDSFFLTIDADQIGDERTYGFELHVGAPEVLLVDDDAGAAWNQKYEQALFDLRVPFAVWDKSVSGTPPSDTLDQYSNVIWFTGDDRADVLSTGDVAAMQTFLDNGGNLFLTGQVIVRELDGENPAFLNNYLKASYLGDQYYPLMNGVAGSAIGDGWNIRYMVGDNQSDPQKMTTINGSSAEFELPVGGVTMLSWAGSYRVVLASFGLEAVADDRVSSGYASKKIIVQRVLEFFSPDTVSLNPTVTTVTIAGETSPLRLIGHTPEFSWTYDDTTGAGSIEYQVQVGTGDLCYNSDDMWSPPVFSGTNTSAVYSGFPLVDGEAYVFRVRVFNGVTWSDWMRTDFGMNAVGSPALLVAPTHDSLLTTSTPTLKVTNTTDPDGDVQTYEFVVYSDQELTTIAMQTSGVVQAPPHTTWTVTEPLADDARYWWRVRPYDGYEYSEWSDVGTFLVSAENTAPMAFSLVAPVHGDTVETMSPTFVWQASSDSDLGDAVSYTLKISEDSLFGTYDFVQLTDTSAMLFDSLVDGTTYFWKVEARDRFGGMTESSETFRLRTVSLSCCVLRGDFTGDGSVKVSDLTAMISYMFRDGLAPECFEHADTNGDGDITVSDLTLMIGYLFRAGAPPVACP